MSSKYTLKTKPTEKDPMQVIAEIPDAKKQSDARAMLSIFANAILVRLKVARKTLLKHYSN